MTQELEQILSQLSQPDNAVIQQVTAQITLYISALVCSTVKKLEKTNGNGLSNQAS